MFDVLLIVLGLDNKKWVVEVYGFNFGCGYCFWVYLINLFGVGFRSR